MKGIEVTAEQMAAARSFFLGRFEPPVADLEDDAVISSRFDNLVRLIAWYGAVRYQAALRNVSTRKYTREEFPTPCGLPQEIRDQILADEGLLKPRPLREVSI
jgi:hypothetical protein